MIAAHIHDHTGGNRIPQMAASIVPALNWTMRDDTTTNEALR